jgi:hypothetical protein
MKNERDRTKLKFYKGEYIGFEVSRKTFEEHRDNMQREFLLKEKRQGEILDEKRRLEELLKVAELELTVLKKENEQYEEKSRISTLAKRDLQDRLRQQMEQTAKL